jgi:hypothetical protein
MDADDDFHGKTLEMIMGANCPHTANQMPAAEENWRPAAASITGFPNRRSPHSIPRETLCRGTRLFISRWFFIIPLRTRLIHTECTGAVFLSKKQSPKRRLTVS